MCAIATGTSYYGLSGMTKNTFEVGLRGALPPGVLCRWPSQVCRREEKVAVSDNTYSS